MNVKLHRILFCISFLIESIRPSPPNIVVLLADDLGYGDLGFTGHPTISTPALDRLAKRGRPLTQFYSAASICSPSRAALLTGRYPVRSGVFPGNFGPENTGGLLETEVTLAEELSSRGYRTSMVGKWHLGVGLKGEYLPTNKGFDSWLGIPYSHDMCPFRTRCNPETYCLGKSGSGPRHTYCSLYNGTQIIQQPLQMTTLTESMTDFARDFISGSAEKKIPFFLFYSFPQPHHPQFSSSRCHGNSQNGPYGDSVAEMDTAVNDIIKQLRESNVQNNTIIWFTSDNGPRKGPVGTEQAGNPGPFSGFKGQIFEGGFRVPSIVYWKDKISDGKPVRSMISTLDMLKTLLSLAGFETENGVDGFDLSNLLLEKKAKGKKGKKKVREEFLYFFRDKPSKKASAIRYKEFKLITQVGLEPLKKPMLFNIDHDPRESIDLHDIQAYKDIKEKILRIKEDLESKVEWGRTVIQSGSEKAMPCCDKTCFERFTNLRNCCTCYFFSKSLFSSTPLAIPNLTHCRALLYCRCVRTWGGCWLGSPGPIELIASGRLAIPAPPAQERSS